MVVYAKGMFWRDQVSTLDENFGMIVQSADAEYVISKTSQENL